MSGKDSQEDTNGTSVNDAEESEGEKDEDVVKLLALTSFYPTSPTDHIFCLLSRSSIQAPWNRTTKTLTRFGI